MDGIVVDGSLCSMKSKSRWLRRVRLVYPQTAGFFCRVRVDMRTYTFTTLYLHAHYVIPLNTICCHPRNFNHSNTHIAGKDNVVCDRLSRLGVSGQSVASIVPECGFGEVKVIDLGLCDNTQHLLSSCNPAISFAAEPEFVNYWSGMRGAINTI